MVAVSEKLTPEAYLQWEESNTTKHEYIDGRVYAMAGANDPHVTIAFNLIALLRPHLRGSGCRLFGLDMKVRIQKQKQKQKQKRDRFFYPDLLVTCDARDSENLQYKRYPKLIVEVLSKSTEAFDRGAKFRDYATLETLEEYAIVDTKLRRVECFRRCELGWFLQAYEGDEFALESIGYRGSTAALYEDVALEEET